MAIRRPYDPRYRSYRLAVYAVFWGALVWLGGSLTWSVVKYLFF